MIRVDRSSASGTYVGVCDTCPWRTIDTSLIAVRAYAAAHEASEHPGAGDQARHAYAQLRRHHAAQL